MVLVDNQEECSGEVRGSSDWFKAGFRAHILDFLQPSKVFSEDAMTVSEVSNGDRQSSLPNLGNV